MPKGSTIQLKGLSKRFGEAAAVSNVDLSIAAGEFLAIMGSSGSGKTTLLRMIAGLDTPSAGTISIDDRDVTSSKPWDRETPLVWQDFALFPHMTVQENVEYGLRMRGVPRSARRSSAIDALRTVGLDGFGERAVQSLSGGQRQRVGLARGIVLTPKVLLLDEPLGALDMSTAKVLQRELKRLHRTLGITFVYVTHNQNEAFTLADRVSIMGGGLIHQVGTPREILTRPSNKFVANFVGLQNFIEASVVSCEPESILVDTPLGRFNARSNDRPDPGSRRLAVVFPDQVTVSIGAGSGIGATVVSIENLSFLVAIVLSTENGSEITVHLPTGEFDTLALNVGSHCRMSLKSESIWLLPDSD